MSEIRLRYNVESGRQYLDALFDLSNNDWYRLHDGYLAGRLSLPEAVVLVHPDWVPGRVSASRRRRAFSLRIPNGQECESSKVWGYPCNIRSPIQVDHSFPYSYGGPTTPSNALYLCEEHNKLKGSDIHLVNWNENNFPWLRSQIVEVQHLLSSAASE